MRSDPHPDPSQSIKTLPFLVDGPPIIETDFQRTPHGDPTDDSQALLDNLTGSTQTKSRNQLTEQQTDC